MIVSKAAGLRKPSIAAGSPKILTLDNPSGWLTGDSSGTVTPTAALKLSAVYCSVEYVCNFIAGLPIYVFDRHARIRVPDHRLMRCLGIRPNEEQTPADYKRMMTRNLELRGNAYAYVYRDAASGYPLELIPLHPDYMDVDLADGHLRYLYGHPKSGKLYCLDPTDVLHYKWNSEDGITGVSVLRYAANTLRTAQAASEYENAVYANGSRPSGVLETDADLGGDSNADDPAHPGRKLSKKENVRRAWEFVYAGSANAFRTAVLDNGLKYKPISVSSFDAQFIAAKDISIADIARFFGVPLHSLMTGKQSYQSNEQNSLEFATGKGLTMIRMMEEEDTYKLLPDSEIRQSYWIKRNMDAKLRGDTASRAAYYKSMWEIGALSVDEINALEDRPDVPGGDVHNASLNYVPLELFRSLSIARNASKKEERNDV